MCTRDICLCFGQYSSRGLLLSIILTLGLHTTGSVAHSPLSHISLDCGLAGHTASLTYASTPVSTTYIVKATQIILIVHNQWARTV